MVNISILLLLTTAKKIIQIDQQIAWQQFFFTSQASSFYTNQTDQHKTIYVNGLAGAKAGGIIKSLSTPDHLLSLI